MKRYKSRVKFTNDARNHDFVYFVVMDSSELINKNSIFESETDLLPLIAYDTATYFCTISNDKLISSIGDFLLDNPTKKAVFTINSNIPENDIKAPLVTSLVYSIIRPFGQICLTRENIDFSIVWSKNVSGKTDSVLVNNFIMEIIEK
jgi:hypothetical protein